MEKNTEFRLQQTQQIKQDQMIYAIIITTDLNKEDENIKQIIERHLRKKNYLK
jgi:5S rRNA maturation endonuclease (ribonuclease M5)